MDTLFLERRNLAAVTAIGDVDLRVGIDFLHEADAARAEDAAVAVEHERRTEVDVRLDALAIEHPPLEAHAALVRAEAVGEVLQRALAALVAHRAVERVVDEQELEDTRARVDDVGGLRVHHHAFGNGCRAGRLQLRHLFDLDDADSAGAVDPEARVVTIVRNPDAGLDGRLEDGPALLSRDGLSVDRQRNGVHKPLILY